MASLDDLLKEYRALSSLSPDKVDVARFNKVKELLGEAGAQLEVAKNGPGRLKDLSIPQRGTKGAQILAGEREDPDVERKIVIDGATDAIVVPQDT